MAFQGCLVYCRPLWASQRADVLLLRSRMSLLQREGSSDADSLLARCRWAWRVTTRGRARPPLMLTLYDSEVDPHGLIWTQGTPLRVCGHKGLLPVLHYRIA